MKKIKSKPIKLCLITCLMAALAITCMLTSAGGVLAADKPGVVAQYPIDKSGNVSVDTAVYVTFNCDVEASYLLGVNIQGNGTQLPGVMVALNGRMLSLSHPGDFDYETEYKVTVPAGSVFNYVYNDEYNWSFVTEPTTNNDDDDNNNGSGGG